MANEEGSYNATQENLRELRERRLKGGSAKTALIGTFLTEMISRLTHPHLSVDYIAAPDLSARARKVGVHLDSCSRPYREL